MRFSVALAARQSVLIELPENVLETSSPTSIKRFAPQIASGFNYEGIPLSVLTD
jgi:hypothetical protein